MSVPIIVITIIIIGQSSWKSITFINFRSAPSWRQQGHESISWIQKAWEAGRSFEPNSLWKGIEVHFG